MTRKATPAEMRMAHPSRTGHPDLSMKLLQRFIDGDAVIVEISDDHTMETAGMSPGTYTFQRGEDGIFRYEQVS